MRLTILLLLLFFCPLAQAAENGEVVKGFIHAFNRHDIEAMLELSADDLRWMSVSGSEISIETSTHDELLDAMSAYFESTPGVRSELRSINESGPFVYAVEEAYWTSGGVEKSQCSIALYELEGKKVKNVWYFPEHPCE